MRISVIGTGYVGLSNAMLFSENHQVIALDIDKNSVKLLQKKITNSRPID